MKRLPSLLVALVLASCATPNSLGAAVSSESSFAIRDVRIFDGERVIPSGTVVVQNGLITAVGEHENLSGVAEVIDGHGQTLLPGLIDAHFHANEPEAYRVALAFGLTTVIDMFGQYSAFKTKTSLGALSTRPDDEADPLISLLITVPAGHGTEYGDFALPKVTTAQECQDAVNTQLDAGATFVKLIYDSGDSWSPQPVPSLSRELLTACIQAAHARGVLAIVHTLSLRQAREAVEAGVDGLAHDIVDVAPEPALVQMIAAHHTFIIPTLAALSGAMGQRNDEIILADPLLAPYVPESGLKTLRKLYPTGFGQGMKPAAMKETLLELKAAGVAILAGSDPGNPQTAEGATFHQELELLVAAGLTPVEVLSAATSLPASRFRLPDRGRIAPGLRADLVLVRGDPTTDIKMTRDIVTVWKRGKKLDRDAYRARVEAARQPSHHD